MGWIGIAHAGTLISPILLLTRQEWRSSINRLAETMTLFAVVCAGHPDPERLLTAAGHHEQLRETDARAGPRSHLEARNGVLRRLVRREPAEQFVSTGWVVGSNAYAFRLALAAFVGIQELWFRRVRQP